MNKTKTISLLLFSTVFLVFSSCDNDDDEKEVEPSISAPTDTCVADTTGTYAQGVSVSGTIGGVTYVDLGLTSGTKWATYNIGASKPTESGSYFAWGETTERGEYVNSTYQSPDYSEWNDYKWCKGKDSTLTRYCNNKKCGSVDNLTTLKLSDDAATINWGANWRTPTANEILELIGSCDWECSGTYLIGTSKANGNTILLPGTDVFVTIIHTATYVNNIGSNYYWSSSLYEDNPVNAQAMYFQIVKGSDFFTGVNLIGFERWYPGHIRAVVRS